jgi:multiple antibiotic resistance protein
MAQQIPVLTGLLKEFLFGFGTLFAIINPYGLSFVFLDHTKSVSDAERRALAKRVAISAFGVLVVSLFAGTAILHFFGVSLPALRIGGGLVVAASGWEMLHEKPPSEGQANVTPPSPQALKRMVIFPLTIPLTTGPGTIATAIALSANRPTIMQGALLPSLVSLVVAIAVSLTILNAYSYSGSMARWFGREGTYTVTRMSAFLLVCVGVQIMLTGTLDAIRPLLPVTG